MSPPTIAEGLGAAAALCSMASFTPQLIKLWREKEASAISLRMYAITVSGFILWTAYGVLIGAWPVIIANAVCLVLSGAILLLTLRYGRREAASLNHAS